MLYRKKRQMLCLMSLGTCKSPSPDKATIGLDYRALTYFKEQLLLLYLKNTSDGFGLVLQLQGNYTWRQPVSRER